MQGWVAPDNDATRRLKACIPDIDRHLSHLRWERVDWSKAPNAKPWAYVQILADLASVFEAFVNFACGQQEQWCLVLFIEMELFRIRVKPTIGP